MNSATEGRRWIIVYEDGATFCSDDGAWEDAPAHGVQAVVFEDERAGWGVRHQGDFYAISRDGYPVGLDHDGMMDYVTARMGYVKVGRMLSQYEFERAYNQAKDICDALRRDGWGRTNGGD